MSASASRIRSYERAKRGERSAGAGATNGCPRERIELASGRFTQPAECSACQNTRLTRQINDLTRKKKLAASDLDRVRRELNRNQQVRETASTQTSTSSRALVNQENQRLNDEVLFLLQK